MKAPFMLFVLSLSSVQLFAQAPTITSISPTVGAPGSNVTINGSGFTGTPQNTFVRFGGALASVSAVQQGTIIAQAPGNATFGPVTVTTNSRSASSRNSFFLRFSGGGIGTSSYQQAVPLGSVSANSQAIACADLDSDGRLDLILPQTNGNTVRVARNATPTGGAFTFDAQVDIPTTWIGARGVATGDIDGDGKLDMIVTCAGSASPGRVAVLRNTSTAGTLDAGSFAASVLFRDTTDVLFIPTDVAIGDFDSDGRPDIAAAGQISTGHQLFIFRNVSSVGSVTASSFEAPVRFAAGTAARRVRVADIDGDGKVDAVVITQSSGNILASVYRNTTSGAAITFAAPVDLTLPAGAVSELAVGDLNDDRKPEIVCASQPVGAGVMTVFENNSTMGNVAFFTGVPFALPTSALQVGLSDVDGDGRPDIQVMRQSHVSVFRNVLFDGPITAQFFAQRLDLTVFTSPTQGCFANGDIDGDAKPEIINTGYGSVAGPVIVLRNLISSGFTPAAINTGTTADLASVSFLDRNNGCIAGRGGIVRSTTNGGTTWMTSNTGVTNDINNIKLIGSRGFIVGTSGLICISTNNGGNWTPFTTGTTETFNGVSFTGESAGWAVGTGGIICRYNGSTWTQQTTGTAITFRGVYAVGTTGYAVGANGTICRYNGTSWVPQTTGVSFQFNDVAFANDQLGYAAGEGGTICKTTNGGTNWIALNTGLGSLNYRGVKLLNANVLWATADGGTVAQSSDGGTTWTTTNLGSANLTAIDFIDGAGTIVGNGGAGYRYTTTLVDVKEISPLVTVSSDFLLEQNYPNPFNPTTKIRYQTPKVSHVTLKVFDILGREVATLVNENFAAGSYEATFDAKGLASGVYLYRLQSGEFTESRRFVLLR